MCDATAYSESGAPIAPTRCAEYIALQQNIARLREALKFYADGGHVVFAGYVFDDGKVARNALKEVG